jgi:hypothetical protein
MESFSDLHDELSVDGGRSPAEHLADVLSEQSRHSSGHNVSVPSDRCNERNFLVHSRLHGRGYVVAVEGVQSATVYSVNRDWTSLNNASLIQRTEPAAEVSVADADIGQLTKLVRTIIMEHISDWRAQ